MKYIFLLLFLFFGFFGYGQELKNRVPFHIFGKAEYPTKTDTIGVVVLCENNLGYPIFVEKRKERQMEYRTVAGDSPPLTLGLSSCVAVWETKWVTVGETWLDPIGGCYGLIPLE